MKKLILILFLLIGGLLKAQTYQADSLQYYSNVFFAPDTTVYGNLTVVIEKGVVTFNNEVLRTRVKIIDTLPRERTGKYSYRDSYTVINLKDSSYLAILYMSYTGDRLIVVGLSVDFELLLYYIQSQLIDTHARQRKPSYFRDWTRTILSGE